MLPSLRRSVPFWPLPSRLTPPPADPLCREDQPGRVAVRGVGDGVDRPADAEVAAEALGGLHDPRLDHHLRLRRVEQVDHREHRVHVRRQLLDDQGVGPAVHDDAAALREQAGRAGPEQARHLVGVGVAQPLVDRTQRDRQRLGGREQLALLGLLAQRLGRRDPHDVAVELIVEVVDLQHLLERLVPGNVLELRRHHAGDARLDDDVQPADLREGAQHVRHVGVGDLEVDRLAEVGLLPARPGVALREPSLQRRGRGRDVHRLADRRLDAELRADRARGRRRAARRRRPAPDLRWWGGTWPAAAPRPRPRCGRG